MSELPTSTRSAGFVGPTLRRRGIIGRVIDAVYGYDIFLSYTRADDPGSGFARAMQSRLMTDTEGSKPLRCFLDVGEIPHDETLSKSLVEKIRASRTLLVLGGPAAADHPWVCFEVETALHYNRRVMILDRGIGWPTCEGKLKSLLPEHVQIDCEGGAQFAYPTGADAARIREQIGSRRVESARRRLWRTVIAALAIMLIATFGMLLRQIDVTQAERDARIEAEENFLLAKNIVDESFTMVEHHLKNVPGVEDYRLALLTKASDYYRQFIDRRKTRELDIEYAEAIVNVGLVDLELGRDAEPAFRKAWMFLDSAAAAQPENFEARNLLFMSGLNRAIAMINNGAFAAADLLLRETLDLGNTLHQQRPKDRHLEMNLGLVQLALGRTLAEQSRGEDALRAFESALTELEDLEQTLKSESDSATAWLTTMVEKYVAGAYRNVANSPTVPLRNRIEAARTSWERYERLVSKDPTNNDLFFQAAQSSRTLAALVFESGDAGEAQIFAERSLLIHHSLAKRYPGNQRYQEEFSGALNFLYNNMTLWQQELWFHEAALDVLRDEYESNVGTEPQRRALAHRLALAHVQIATYLVRNAIIGESPLPSTDAKGEAREHLQAAAKINAEIRTAGASAPYAAKVMHLNIPWWLDFTR